VGKLFSAARLENGSLLRDNSHVRDVAFALSPAHKGDQAMHVLFRSVVAAALTGLALANASCTMVVSEHPLSDEKTSKLDERAIGFWEIVPEEKDKEKPRAQFAVGRVKEKKNSLEMVALELHKDQVQVKRFPVYTTVLDNRRYLSWGNAEEKDPGFFILHYKFADEKTVHLYELNPDFVGDAIQRGELAGNAVRREESKDPKDAGPKYKSVLITAESKEIAAFVKKNAAKCFEMDRHGTLKRIKPE